MTAESVIMNKSAVAMAADSAVTISLGRGGVKTYDTVNKLFELVKGSAVGVMVYANAEMSGVPWETLIKCYRTEHSGFKASHLEDYAAHFLAFLSGTNELLAEENEEFVVTDTAYNLLLIPARFIVDRSDYWLTDSTGRIIKSRLRETVKDAIDAFDTVIQNSREADWAPTMDLSRLQADYGQLVEILVDEVFQKFALRVRQRARLRDLCLEGLRRCIKERAESGLVIAGFGEQDVFPKTFSATVRGRVAGVLRTAHPTTKPVTLSEPGVLLTFAQDEMAWGYLSGINDRIRSSIVHHWGTWAHSLDARIRDQVHAALPRLRDSTLEAIRTIVEDEANAQVSRFAKDMGAFEYERFLRPILDSIGLLPKDELGLMAESLVNLASLRQRVSIYDAQTVGGAIDVALISPGDGFVWLKRKHYFQSHLNPGWHLTHAARIGNATATVTTGGTL